MSAAVDRSHAENPALAHAVPLADGRIYFTLWLLLTAVAWAQAAGGEGPAGGLVSALFWGGLFAGSLLLGRGQAHSPRPLATQLRDAAAVAGLMAFLAMLLLRGLTDALATLLLWLQVAKNCTLVNKRDLHFALALSFVLLTFAAAESRSGVFLLFTVIYVLAGVYTLVLAYADECRAGAAGVAETEGRLPASVLPLAGALLLVAGALYLFVPRPQPLLFGAFLDSGGTDYYDQRWERQAGRDWQEADAERGEGPGDGAGSSGKRTAGDRPGSRLRLGERGEPVAGSERGAEGAPGRAGSAAEGRSAGQTEGGSAGGQGQERTRGGEGGLLEPVRYWLAEDIDLKWDPAGRSPNRLVLRVQAPRPLYLRARVLESFDGQSWRQEERAERKHRLKDGELRLKARGGSAPEIEQQVEVVEPLTEVLPGAAEVVAVEFPGNALAEHRYGDLRAPRQLAAKTRYTITSRFHSLDGRPYYGAALDEPERFLKLPANHDPAIIALAERVAGGHDGLGAALLIEQHLRGEYRYTLEEGGLPAERPLSHFLFERRSGHCSLFASAMAVMLRGRGIPARVATGFAASKLNPLTGYYEVWSMDAHAWVEAWLPEYGWVLFEPTPAYRLPGGERPANTAGEIEEYLAEMSRMEQATRAAGSGGGDWRGAAAEAMTQLRQGALSLALAGYRLVIDYGLWLAAVVVTLALSMVLWPRLRGPWLDRRALRRLDRARADPVTLALACWLELERWYGRRGLPRPPGASVEEHAQSLAAHTGAEAAVTAAAELFVRVRYGDERPAGEEAEAAFRAVGRLLRGGPAAG